MTTKGVTESKTGTMSETDGQLKPPSNEDKIPGGVKVSPEDTPTISQKEFDEAVSHAAKSEGSRVTKALETREQAVKDAVAKEAERQTARNDQELADAKDDPAELTLIQRRQAIRKRELDADEKDRTLTAREAANQADIDAAKATRFETDVFEIATKQEVSADSLMKFAKKYGITDLDLLEEHAKGASTKVATGPDPGRNIGGGELTEQERLDKRYPSMAK